MNLKEGKRVILYAEYYSLLFFLEIFFSFRSNVHLQVERHQRLWGPAGWRITDEAQISEHDDELKTLLVNFVWELVSVCVSLCVLQEDSWRRRKCSWTLTVTEAASTIKRSLRLLKLKVVRMKPSSVRQQGSFEYFTCSLTQGVWSKVFFLKVWSLVGFLHSCTFASWFPAEK